MKPIKCLLLLTLALLSGWGAEAQMTGKPQPPVGLWLQKN